MAGNPAAAPSGPILRVEELAVAYSQGGRPRPAVREISFAIRAGETLGLVGESGSGKTTIALAILQALPPRGWIESGRIFIGDDEVSGRSCREMQRIWGRRVTMVPQEPMSALNPSIRVGEQVAEALRYTLALSRAQARERTKELFGMVHLADPSRVAASYPHELSGGMQQRVMIAMAVSADPDLLILDEPTTGLDATTQAAFLDLVRELTARGRRAVLYISHNLGVVAQVCDRVTVLYAGDIVEAAATSDVIDRPLHPYSVGLFASVPRIGEHRSDIRLRAMAGRIPELGNRSAGCLFAPRCPLAIDVCSTRPQLNPAAGERLVRCHRWKKVATGATPLFEKSGAQEADAGGERSGSLEVAGLFVHFAIRRSLGEAIRRRPGRSLRALDGIDLAIPPGSTLGLVGESGSGKTTVARAVAGLAPPTGGAIALNDAPLSRSVRERPLEQLRELQLVFQNTGAAFNPYLTIGESLSRPLVRLAGTPRGELRERVEALLTQVGLPATFAGRLPASLSGGEKQRAAIARAFAANPSLLICDEAVSALDVSVQASVLNLLNALKARSGGSILFISHDLAVVAHMADLVAVIYLGKIMEVSPRASLFHPPYHPYTEALLSAIPLIEAGRKEEVLRLSGEVPSPTARPAGCPFATRCPRSLGERCEAATPSWQVHPSGKRVFCHIPLSVLERIQKRVLAFEREGE